MLTIHITLILTLTLTLILNLTLTLSECNAFLVNYSKLQSSPTPIDRRLLAKLLDIIHKQRDVTYSIIASSNT